MENAEQFKEAIEELQAEAAAQAVVIAVLANFIHDADVASLDEISDELERIAPRVPMTRQVGRHSLVRVVLALSTALESGKQVCKIIGADHTLELKARAFVRRPDNVCLDPADHWQPHSDTIASPQRWNVRRQETRGRDVAD